jgi:hypothetical protein
MVCHTSRSRTWAGGLAAPWFLGTRGATRPLGRPRPRQWGSRRTFLHRVDRLEGALSSVWGSLSSYFFTWSASKYYRTGRALSASEHKRRQLELICLLYCTAVLFYAMLRYATPLLFFLLCISLLLGGRLRYFAVCPGFYRQSIRFFFISLSAHCLWNSHSYLLKSIIINTGSASCIGRKVLFRKYRIYLFVELALVSIKIN